MVYVRALYERALMTPEIVRSTDAQCFAICRFLISVEFAKDYCEVFHCVGCIICSICFCILWLAFLFLISLHPSFLKNNVRMLK